MAGMNARKMTAQWCRCLLVSAQSAAGDSRVVRRRPVRSNSTLGPVFCPWNRISPRLVGGGTPDPSKRFSESDFDSGDGFAGPTVLALMAAICLWGFVASAAMIYSSALGYGLENKSVLLALQEKS